MEVSEQPVIHLLKGQNAGYNPNFNKVLSFATITPFREAHICEYITLKSDNHLWADISQLKGKGRFCTDHGLCSSI